MWLLIPHIEMLIKMYIFYVYTCIVTVVYDNYE